MATGATAFLGSASERLLPLSLPFRFFGAAVVFHLAAWGVLVLAAGEVADYRGGAGPVLAAVHLLTLGVFTMTAMGASLQLLPVATLQGFAAPRLIGLIWWLFSLGTVILSAGMFLVWHQAMAGGGVLAGLAILLYLWLLLGNLRRGGALRAVVAHGWLSAASLLGLLALGLGLIANQEHDLFADAQRGAAVHMLLAGYGFMGLLAMGFSYVLVPMFALTQVPPAKAALASLGLAVAGLGLALAGVWSGQDGWAAVGAAAGLIAVAIHLGLMVQVLRQRMRKRLGPAFILIRLSWALLPISLLLGIAWAMDNLPDWGGAVFTLSLFAWLLSLLMAILQRIVPFLASMHAATAIKRRPPTVTALTAQVPLSIHLYCHCAAFVLLCAGIIWPVPLLVGLGALTGAVGAAAFAWFFLAAVKKYRAALEKAAA
ncbi:MAG: hypothetical protein QF384_06525, partial [Alphaproteobacteria bacterium]|nr:hypothetical protein [Alphaproteobacteria bacterium]